MSLIIRTIDMYRDSSDICRNLARIKYDNPGSQLAMGSCGSWASSKDLIRLPMFHELQHLLHYIVGGISGHSCEVPSDNLEGWANILPPGEYIDWHDHANDGNIWSAALYLTPGKLLIRGNNRIHDADPETWIELDVDCGHLILFSPRTQHRVPPSAHFQYVLGLNWK